MDLVWHYTNGAGLIGIVESKKLWATQIQYLNDRLEYLLVYEAAVSILGRYNEFVEGWSVDLPDLSSALKANLVEAAATYQQGGLPELFVVSLTTERDSLSQWRGYGNGPGDTYTVGFDAEALRVLAESRGWRFEQCIYGTETIERRIIEHLRKLFERYSQGEWSSSEDPPKDAVTALVSDLIEIAVLVKNSGFQEEREIRLISPFINERNPCLKFRPGKTSLLPYVEFDLNADDSAFRQLFNGVGVGPGPSQNLAMSSASALQTRNPPGSGAACYPSSIPYRSI